MINDSCQTKEERSPGMCLYSRKDLLRQQVTVQLVASEHHSLAQLLSQMRRFELH